jgi:hypothetical protein
MALNLSWFGAICPSSGGRILTCDLWVMSRPIAVSTVPPQLESSISSGIRLRRVTSRLTRTTRFHPVLATCLATHGPAGYSNSRTSTIGIYGVGPVVAGTVLGDVRRFDSRDHFPTEQAGRSGASIWRS